MTDRQRRLGFVSAAALVVANMVGTGVFTISGFALAELQNRNVVLLAWLAAGGIAICGALCYGALGRRFPTSGGEYVFLSRTIHPLAGFMAGWIGLLAGFTAPIAAAALALEAYLPALVAPSLPTGATGGATIIAAGLAHGIRLRLGAFVQNALVLGLLILILLFLAVGIVRMQLDISTVALFEADWGGFGSSVVWISFAYSGWNAAVYIGGTIKKPTRTLPRALVAATISVTCLYLVLNAVFLYSAPVARLAGRPDVAVVAARALGGVGLQRLLASTVVVALVTSIFAMVMAGPRVIACLAKDGLLPAALMRLKDVPSAAVAVQVSLAVVITRFSSLSELLGYIGLTLTLCAALTVIGLIVVRRKEGAERVPIPGYPWIPLLFVAASLYSAVATAIRDPCTALVGALMAGLGVLAYLWRQKGVEKMRIDLSHGNSPSEH